MNSKDFIGKWESVNTSEEMGFDTYSYIERTEDFLLKCLIVDIFHEDKSVSKSNVNGTWKYSKSIYTEIYPDENLQYCIHKFENNIINMTFKDDISEYYDNSFNENKVKEFSHFSIPVGYQLTK